MKKKLALLLAGILALGSFAGCGGDSGSKDKGKEQSSVNADGELEGDITFWHSFTQGGRLDTIQKPFLGMTFIQSGQQDLLQETCQI